MITKNLSMLKKLILAGFTLVLFPLVIVASLSIMKATSYLDSFSTESLSQISQSLADMTGKSLLQELKLVKQISLENTVISMASTVERFGRENVGSAPEQLVMMLSTAMREIGDEYEGILITDPEGIVYADGSGGKLKGTSLSAEEYFLIAKNGTPNIGNVTRSASTGKLIVPVSAPIFSDKKSCLGCVILFVQIDSILNKIRAAKIGHSGYAFMIDACALVLEHANPDYVLQHTINDTLGMEGIATKMTAQEKGIVEYVSGDVEYVAGIAPVPITGWSIGATQPRREFLAPVRDIRTIIMVVGAFTLAVATLFIVLFARSITNPLSKGVQIAKNMADGDFSQSIDVKQTDEIGVLADALRNMIDRLGNFIIMVKNASQHVDLASEEVSSGTQGLSRATQVQATAIEQIAATIEEFASTTKQNASNAGLGLKKSQDTKKVLHTNMDIGKKLSEAMNDISQVSGKIEEIISTVNEVAFQTNLLALNAAVEAARAGEHGKGFAVVADEVRSLAQKASAASKQIKGLIEDTLGKISVGSELVGDAETSLIESVSLMDDLSETMNEIASATSEQTNGIDGLSHSILQIEKITQDNASTVEELAKAAESMSNEAKELSNMLSLFKTPQRKAG